MPSQTGWSDQAAPQASPVSPTQAQKKPGRNGKRPDRQVDLEHELTKGFAARLIRQKAKQLVGHFGLTVSDRRDLEGEFKLALLERFDQFDPAVANWEAFATIVVDHRIATMIEERWAEKREYRRNVVSLATLVQDPDGELVELSEQIGEDHLERVTGVAWPDRRPEFDLEHDVASVLSKMPTELRALCERLKKQSIAEAAREMNTPRTTVYRMLDRARELFEAEGFSE